MPRIRRSLLGNGSTPRQTAQSVNRRAMQQGVRQLAKSSSLAGTPVKFGSVSKANLKVVVRVRPLNTREIDSNAR